MRFSLPFLLTLTLVFGQRSKPITADDLIKMKSAGLDSQTVVKLIETNGSTIDTSADAILALKNAGVDSSVIRAAISSTRPDSSSLITSPLTQPSGPIPEEAGIYVQENDKFRTLPVEIPKQKSTSPFKVMATGGFGSVKVQGELKGSKSSLQLTAPVVLIVRCPAGMNIESYQLLTVESKKDTREFTTSRMSAFRGMSSGQSDKEVINIRFEKIGPQTFRTPPSNLKRGEYGIYNATGGPMAGLAKMYTFGVQ